MAQSKNRKSGATSASSMAIGAVLGLVVVGLVVWWFAFRDTSAASVDSVAAAEARQEAIDALDEPAGSGESAVSIDDEAAPESVDTVPATEDRQDAVDAGTDLSNQADPATVGEGALQGVWTVDSSIGTFDDACLDVACSASFVGFRINEELVGFGAKTVVGRTPVVSGSLEMVGTQIVSTEIRADMTQLMTDDTGRTSALKSASGGLETATFPEASFVLTGSIELGSVPVEGASIQIPAVGDLTVHGVTKSVTIPLTAEVQAGLVVVYGSLVDIALADFEIPKPTSIVVLSVEEIATMEFQLFLRR